jgi:hypothetical protein
MTAGRAVPGGARGTAPAAALRPAAAVPGREPAGAPPPLLPGSALATYQGFQVELHTGSASRHPELLAQVREDVLEVAARSRGWTEPGQIASFGQVFKIEPLFHADGLALVWRHGRLVGLAGTAYEPPPPGGGLVLHLCSLGLLPQAQNRGFLPTLFSLLWDVVDGLPGVEDAYRRGRVYLTAITQNPFIVAFLGQVSDLYPAPGRAAPDPDMVAVAHRLADRFAPGVSFDPGSFVLRNECEFFYRKIPYSADRRVNAYCDARLRYHEGDTFVLVGRARRTAVARFVRSSQRAHPALFAALRASLRAGPTGPDRRPVPVEGGPVEGGGTG